MKFEQECVSLLQSLIRIPTVGFNETKAAKLLQKVLPQSEIIESVKSEPGMMQLIHGPDERISVSNLMHCTQFYYELLKDC